MTLQPYNSERLNELALRALDLGAALRRMALKAPQLTPPGVALHDKKALEWLEKLEEWIRKAESDLQIATIRRKGQERAEQLPETRSRAK